MRKLLSVLAAAATAMTLTSGAVVATSVPPASAATYEGPGSASPEEAVSMYMDGLAGADVDAMVSSFAVETFVDSFDFRAFLERVGAYSAAASPLLVPAETPFSRALGIEQRRGDVIGQIVYQYVALADPELVPNQTINLTDEAALEDFYSGLASAVAAVDTADAGSFTFVSMADVDPHAAADYGSEQNQANIEALRAVFGADELTDLVVQFTVGEQEYLAFFSVARYGDAWWIEQLGGNFANLLGIGALQVGAVPTDEID